MKRTAEITLETTETITIGRPDLIVRDYCLICCEMSDLVTPFVIASLSNITEREIFRLVEAGRIFSLETDRLRVCLRCVAADRRQICKI